MSSIKSGKSYLLGYNSLQLLGWSYILYTFVSEAFVSGNWLTYGSHVEFLLRIFQTLALLEVVHAAVGLVRSSPFATAMQISSRVFVVWGILFLLPEVKEQSIGIPLILLSWSFAEIIRYVFYALNICNISISVVTWLRYSAFMFLYPTGITGELVLMYRAVQVLHEVTRYTLPLPNALNCNFDYQIAILCLMVSYVPLAPKLYLYMLGQRRKVFEKKNQ